MRLSACLFLPLALGCARPAPPAPVSAAELRQAVRAADAPAVLVNMWATWCEPCRQEFPDLLRLRRAYAGRGLTVLFVSWDRDPAVAVKFLDSQGVDFRTYRKSEAQGDPDFIKSFEPAWSGAFPATLLYGRDGALRRIWEGKRGYADFESAVRDVLREKTQGGNRP